MIGYKAACRNCLQYTYIILYDSTDVDEIVCIYVTNDTQLNG